MASANVFGKANDEFVNENYQKAIELYTEAISIDGGNEDFYLNRSQAYFRLEEYEEALKDVEKAMKIDSQNCKAFLRKGIILFHLQQYLEARDVFVRGQQINCSDQTFVDWITKCESAGKFQNEKNGQVQQDAELEQDEDGDNSSSSRKRVESRVSRALEKADQVDTPEAALPSPIVAPKVRYDWYQTQSHVVITVMLKKIKQDDLNVNIQKKSLEVYVKLAAEEENYKLVLNLAHVVVPAHCQTKIMASKIEIKLKKEEGIHWTNLEGEQMAASEQVKQIPAASNQYPSSSHKGHNWDRIAHELMEQEKNEKKEGDEALNHLFQQIYADGTDDVKRAMVKSFYESGGTVLSTNWSDVSAKKVEVKPPDGTEFIKWSQ